ncbi:uncharacterized protein [Periplaneta americana]|uniref:uncharacterized protein n=1 Tax=Periplaneta americana TaxID=6978 RepID=UPI0037E99E37
MQPLLLALALALGAAAPTEDFCTTCIDTNSEFCCKFFDVCCLDVSPCPLPARPQFAACHKTKCTRASDCRKGQPAVPASQSPESERRLESKKLSEQQNTSRFE